MMTALFTIRRSQSSTGSNGWGRRAAGFTLIEVMIVVAIIAILASIAYASYDDSVVKTRRKTATGCMVEAAQFMERYYTTNLTYVGAALPALNCQTDMAANYTISLNASTASTYTLQVAPQGAQATKDTKCGTLTLDNAGAKTESGSAANAGECW